MEHKEPRPMDWQERYQDILAHLKGRGRRLTPQRLAILKILAISEGHPTVEQIHQSILREYPTTSLATVYKTVNLLGAEGQVLELEFSEMPNRYDGNKPYPHPHVICKQCGKILDSEVIALEEVTRKIMAETGFLIMDHRLDFYGLCTECQK